MKNRQIALLLVALMAGLVIVRCGSSASAPPVNLPAPITGRITVSSPDADGNVSITGDAGAVDGGATVMAVNETVAGVVSWKVIEFLVSKAFATSDQLPSACSETGHACAVASTDGSFTISIRASASDSIAIGVIDSLTGEFISDLLRQSVPSSGSVTGACEGKGLSGAVVDIALVPSVGTPILLKQGSDTTTNRLLIGASSPTTSDIEGCYAHSLAITTNAGGNVILAVTSKDDKILWTGELVGTNIEGGTSFTLGYEPMHIAFAGDATSAIVALKTDSSVVIAKASLSDGGTTTTSSVLSGHTESTDIDILAMYDTAAHYLGALVTKDASTSYLTLFEAGTPAVLTTFSFPNDLGLTDGRFADLFFHPLATDAAMRTSSLVLIAVIGDTNALLRTKYLIYNTSSYLYATDDITSSSIVTWSAPRYLADASISGLTATGLTISESAKQCSSCSPPTAIVPTTNGQVLAIALGSQSMDATSTAVATGQTLGHIAADDSTQSIYAVDTTNGTVVSAPAVSW